MRTFKLLHYLPEGLRSTDLRPAKSSNVVGWILAGVYVFKEHFLSVMDSINDGEPKRLTGAG